MAEGDLAKPVIRYVSKDLSDGWVGARPERGAIFSIPSYLKVSLYREEPDRSYFTILEGTYKGVKASTGRLRGRQYLVEGLVHGPAGTVRLNRAQQRLWYGTNGPFLAFTGAFGPWTAIPVGNYKLQIPDAPHKSNRYADYTAHQTTWFRIMGNGLGADSSRYLHLGELSEGCVTVRAFVFDPKKPQSPVFQDWANIPESSLGGWGIPYPKGQLAPVASWDEVYKYLISSRLDDQFVGTLVVE